MRPQVGSGMFERLIAARPIEDVLRDVVVAFRVGAFLWMASLTISTLATDNDANRAIVVTALAVALVWTAATVVAGSRRVLGTWWFVSSDGVIAIFLTLAPGIADSNDFFYGGMPLSWLFVAAYAAGFRWALASSGFLALSQLVGDAIWPGDTLTQLVGRVLVFVIPAVVIGGAFDVLRATEHKRRLAEEALAEERAERALQEERVLMARHLHDSVLQTLTVIESRTADSEARRMARSERRRLRRLIDSLSYGPQQSLKARLREIADEVEDRHDLRVDTAIVGNDALDPDLERLCSAAQEALTNAARHSGSDRISLFAQAQPTQAVATVKDEGGGLPDGRAKAEIEQTLLARIRPSQGSVTIESRPNELTIVEIMVRRDHG